jgi:hypothetical protein
VKRPSIHRLKQYAVERLRLGSYLRSCGDGRSKPQIPAATLVWALLAAQLLREVTFHALEMLVRSAPRRLGIGVRFGDDTLGYFTERLDPQPTRLAMIGLLHRAKRNKAFDGTAHTGLALDGTTVGRCAKSSCPWCRPYRNQGREIAGYRHHLAMVTVVGAGLALPFDVEPYGRGDSEYAAGQRLLRRVLPVLGKRFADYLVVDAAFATNTFLHTCSSVGIPVVARLKNNLPELASAVEKRFGNLPPHRVLTIDGDRVEFWDASDFDPWETLQWQTVRVLRYRQHRPDGDTVEAEWLTNLSAQRVNTLSLYRMAKSRWTIENEGFNDCKNRQGLEHICHHQSNSLLVIWLLTLLALIIARLYRLRYLHRGAHPIYSAIELVRLLRLSLGSSPTLDTG